MPPSWKHSRSGWMGLWAIWSSRRCPCSVRGGWTRWHLKIPSNPNYSTVLCVSYLPFCLTVLHSTVSCPHCCVFAFYLLPFYIVFSFFSPLFYLFSGFNFALLPHGFLLLSPFFFWVLLIVKVSHDSTTRPKYIYSYRWFKGCKRETDAQMDAWTM